MEREDLNKYIGNIGISLVDAMKKIDNNGAGILYIIDENGILAGSLSDGDIRRWIIRTGDLNAKAGQAVCGTPSYLLESDPDEGYRIMSMKKLSSLPILDQEGRIQDVMFLGGGNVQISVENSNALSGVPVIIMAGGKGTRLYPYTKILPKPLIPIGEIPIIERIIERFVLYGVKRFFLTVNYKKEMIKSYFYELSPEYELCYVEEDQPLGTAGSIRLIDEALRSPVIITNCDTIIRTDYEKLLAYHQESGNALTIVSSLKNTVLPYGVIHSRGQGTISSIEEKPSISFLINTGMYVMNPEHIWKIPPGKVYHMTDLANQLMDDGCKVGMYPVSEESFLDMGEFAEMKKMEERMNAGFDLSEQKGTI